MRAARRAALAGRAQIIHATGYAPRSVRNRNPKRKRGSVVWLASLTLRVVMRR